MLNSRAVGEENKNSLAYQQGFWWPLFLRELVFSHTHIFYNRLIGKRVQPEVIAIWVKQRCHSTFVSINVSTFMARCASFKWTTVHTLMYEINVGLQTRAYECRHARIHTEKQVLLYCLCSNKQNYRFNKCLLANLLVVAVCVQTCYLIRSLSFNSAIVGKWPDGATSVLTCVSSK